MKKADDIVEGVVFMPNWCDNHLRVKGSKEKVDEFVSKFQGLPADWGPDWFLRHAGVSDEEIIEKHKAERESLEPGPCFNALYPVPEEILKQGYDRIGYEWCVRHWSTKWDAYGCFYAVERPGEEEAYYGFETAWGPPTNWVKHVSRMFPDLVFELEYCETGVGFAGLLALKNGSVCQSEDYSFDEDYQKYAEFCFERFGEEIGTEEEEA